MGFLRSQQYLFRCTALALLCVVVSACDSGASSSPPNVPIIDDAATIEDAQPGTLDLDGPIALLMFLGNEDEALTGELSLLPVENEESSVPSSSEQITVQSLPESGTLTLVADSLLFQYIAEPDFFGTDSFVYTTEDGNEVRVVIDIEPVPDAPVLSPVTSIQAEQGRPFSLLLEVADADGDDVFFDGSSFPDWLTLDARSGLLSGVPEQSDIGTSSIISLTARDGTGLVHTIDGIEVSVVDINDAPQLNITQVPRILYGRDVVSFRVFPADLDDDPVSVSVDSSPYFDSTVNRDLIELRVKNINEAVSEPLTIVARDELGATTREEIQLRLLPRTESGNGITVSGFKEGRGVHVVILGDGYASDQQGSFRL